MFHMILKAVLVYHLYMTNACEQPGVNLDSAAKVLELIKNNLGLHGTYSEFNSSWKQQLMVAIEVFIFQNNIVGFPKDASSGRFAVDSNLRKSPKDTSVHILTTSTNLDGFSIYTKKDTSVVVLFDSLTSRVAADFTLEITSVRSDIYFLTYELGNSTSLPGIVNKLINILQDNCNNISSVLIFSDDVVSITTVLNTVVATNDLKFTGVLHTTEWIIVTSLDSQLLTQLQSCNTSVDFITAVYRSASNSTLIAQKSRIEGLKPKARVTSSDVSLKQHEHCFRQKLRNKFQSYKDLRKNSLIYLKSQKSMLSGMRVPACLFHDGRHFIVTEQTGNQSGYAYELMKHMEYFLDFTTYIVNLTDHGFYGTVYPNGSASGLAGLLKRREIAFSTMPMSRTQSRISLTEFIPVVINIEPMVFVYRLPEHKTELDLIYTDIFKPNIFVLFGPILALALLGAAMHVTTRSCTLKLPEPVSKSHLRRLLSFPEHVCFLSSSPYRGQAGRLLQASWAITWFFLVSAYSTFLVTTFTTKPQELVINSLEKLHTAKEYEFGIYGAATALLNMLESSDDKIQRQIWNKLKELNKTDDRTISSDLDVHARRVVAEKYVWITTDCANMADICDQYFKHYTDDIRGYIIRAPDDLINTYITTPKNVFYEDIFYNLLLGFEKNGILKYLKSGYLSTTEMERKQISRFNNEQTQVSFRRIQLPVYAVLVGVGLAVVVLIVELVYQARKMKNGSQ